MIIYRAFACVAFVILLCAGPVVAAQQDGGPFEPTWDSIRANYSVPQWFLDGKFGIFIHWGVYSVPAHVSEWYSKYMYGNNAQITQWHAETFGPQDRFGYKDFVPMFEGEKFDPNAWAELFKKSGARYVLPTAEHHDGFAMWDSALTRWDAKDMGPKRDVMGELAVACRRQGLKFGLANGIMEHYSFMYPQGDLKTDLFDPAYADFYGPPKQGPPDERFQEDYWFARNKEMIDKYRPDMLWLNAGVNSRDLDPIKLKLAAYYYNRARQWGQAVSISTKADGFLDGSIRDFDTQGLAPKEMPPYVWQVTDSVTNRFGYVADMRYKDPGLLVRRLVDTVSKNGNYLLNVCPPADGSIPDPQRQRLLEVGKWLQVNGEAIYGTGPWIRYGEGPYYDSPPGRVGDDPLNEYYSDKEVRFTTKGPVLYAIIMDWPDREAVVKSLAGEAPAAGRIKSVYLLGHQGALKFAQGPEGLEVEMPAEKPCNYAFVLKISR
jgi:alpha-L-fucosidase